MKTKIYLIFIVLFSINITCSNKTGSSEEINGKYYQEGVDWVYFNFDGTGNVTYNVNEGITQFKYTIEGNQINLKDESDQGSFTFTIIDANTLESEMMGKKFTYIKKE